MAATGSFRSTACAVLAFGALAGMASAQPATPPAPPPATTTNAVAPDPGLHDRVLALVQARKCSPAHDEAMAGGDEYLAQQVTELCGLRPTRDGGSKGGGGRKSGGGQRPPGR